jgi:hypothetical protein
MGKRPNPPRGGPDPTVELSDSQILPASPAASRPVAPPKRPVAPQDVSMWKGQVLASDDFAPTPVRRSRASPWIVVAVLGASAAAAVVYVRSRPDAAVAPAAQPTLPAAAAVTAPPPIADAAPPDAGRADAARPDAGGPDAGPVAAEATSTPAIVKPPAAKPVTRTVKPPSKKQPQATKRKRRPR